MSSPLSEQKQVTVIEATRDTADIPSESLRKGKFMQQFIVDLTPPTIISIQNPIQSQYLPVRVTFKVSESAQCRFNLIDGSYDELSQLASNGQYKSTHAIVISTATS